MNRALDKWSVRSHGILVRTYFDRVVVDRIDAIESEPYPNENKYRSFTPLSFLRFGIISLFLSTRIEGGAYTVPVVRGEVRSSIDIGSVDN